MPGNKIRPIVPEKQGSSLEPFLDPDHAAKARRVIKAMQLGLQAINDLADEFLSEDESAKGDDPDKKMIDKHEV